MKIKFYSENSEKTKMIQQFVETHITPDNKLEIQNSQLLHEEVPQIISSEGEKCLKKITQADYLSSSRVTSPNKFDESRLTTLCQSSEVNNPNTVSIKENPNYSDKLKKETLKKLQSPKIMTQSQKNPPIKNNKLKNKPKIKRNFITQKDSASEEFSSESFSEKSQKKIKPLTRTQNLLDKKIFAKIEKSNINAEPEEISSDNSQLSNGNVVRLNLAQILTQNPNLLETPSTERNPPAEELPENLALCKTKKPKTIQIELNYSCPLTILPSPDSAFKEFGLLSGKRSEPEEIAGDELSSFCESSDGSETPELSFPALKLYESNSLNFSSYSLEDSSCVFTYTYMTPNNNLFSIYILRSDITLLRPGYSLSSNMIEFFQGIIQGIYFSQHKVIYYIYYKEEQLAEEYREKVFVFPPKFFDLLNEQSKKSEEGGLENRTRIKNLTENCKVFEKDFWLIPMQIDSCWILGVVCFPGAMFKSRQLKKAHVKAAKQTSLILFCSCACNLEHVQKTLKEFIVTEYWDSHPSKDMKRKTEATFSKHFKVLIPKVPYYEEEDSGILTIKFANEFLRSPYNIFRSLRRNEPIYLEWLYPEYMKNKRAVLQGSILQIIIKKMGGDMNWFHLELQNKTPHQPKRINPEEKSDNESQFEYSMDESELEEDFESQLDNLPSFSP